MSKNKPSWLLFQSQSSNLDDSITQIWTQVEETPILNTYTQDSNDALSIIQIYSDDWNNG